MCVRRNSCSEHHSGAIKGILMNIRVYSFSLGKFGRTELSVYVCGGGVCISRVLPDDVYNITNLCPTTLSMRAFSTIQLMSHVVVDLKNRVNKLL